MAYGKVFRRFHYKLLDTLQVCSDKQGVSTKEDNSKKENKEPDNDDDKDQLEEKQEEETGELKPEVFIS
jgi:hypothetical protein